jgi:hypothetical protein
MTFFDFMNPAHMYATRAAVRIHNAAGGDSGRGDFAIARHPTILRLSGTTGKADFLPDEQFPLGSFSFATYRSQTVWYGPETCW